MGDPKRIRKKYDTPIHPWIKSRIDDERRIAKEFGTKNKKEIWKMETILKKFKQQAKLLITLKTEQANVERKHLFRRMGELGLVKGEVSYDEILSLTLDDVMARRLQSVLVAKELARSMNQARQFITHGHVLVEGKVITSPSYLVRISEEPSIAFAVKSPFVSETHPERAKPEEKKEKKAEAEKQPKPVMDKKTQLEEEAISEEEVKKTLTGDEEDLKEAKAEETQKDEKKETKEKPVEQKEAKEETEQKDKKAKAENKEGQEDKEKSEPASKSEGDAQ
jgi:small subunit ribosomal protein S4